MKRWVVSTICLVSLGVVAACSDTTDPDSSLREDSGSDVQNGGTNLSGGGNQGGGGSFEAPDCASLDRNECVRASACISVLDGEGEWIGCRSLETSGDARTRTCYWDEDCTLGQRCAFAELPEEDWDNCFCEPCLPGEECPPCTCDPIGEGFCMDDPEAIPCTDDAECSAEEECVVSSQEDCACPPCSGDDCEPCLCEERGWCVERGSVSECVRDADCPAASFCVEVRTCTEDTCEESRTCKEAQCADDASTVTCNIPRPTCEPGYVAVVESGCYTCVDARTCGANTACTGAFIGPDGMCQSSNGEPVPDSCCGTLGHGAQLIAEGLAQEMCASDGVAVRLDVRDPRSQPPVDSCGAFDQGDRISVTFEQINGRRQSGSLVWGDTTQAEPTPPLWDGATASICTQGRCTQAAGGEISFVFSESGARISGEFVLYMGNGEHIDLPFEARMCVSDTDLGACL